MKKRMNEDMRRAAMSVVVMTYELEYAANSTSQYMAEERDDVRAA